MSDLSLLAQAEVLIARAKKVTSEEVAGAESWIEPIADGVPVKDGILSPDGMRAYTLLVTTQGHLDSVLMDPIEEGTWADNPHNKMEGAVFARELGTEAALLWQLIEYECMRRFPTELGQYQIYGIGPGFQVFLIPGPSEAKRKRPKKGIGKNFVSTHLPPNPTDLPN